jgi:hypothetical protein
VKAGTLCYYVMTAVGADSLETSMTAGLPASWQHSDIGTALFDGSVFTLEDGGLFQFTYCAITGNRVITARFIPQVSSQSSRFGVMMRAGGAADSPQVAPLLAPTVRGADRERPDWHVSMMANGEVGTSPNLGGPYVTSGRLLRPYWLRLERTIHWVHLTGRQAVDGGGRNDSDSSD